MNTFSISRLTPALAFDSRGTPTVSCRVELAGGAHATATVPSGASTGGHEAAERRDGGPAFGGQGVTAALSAITDEIADAIIGMEVRTPAQLSDVDGAMVGLDGTPTLGRLGSNAILAVSVAAALAASSQNDQQPYEWFAAGQQPLLPMPMVNIFSGGAHATGALDVQDVLVVPVAARSVEQALTWVWEVRAAVARLLTERGKNAKLVADEGGFGIAFPNTEACLELVVDGISAAGLTPGEEMAIAMDIAANELLVNDGYELAAEKRRLTSAEFVTEIATWCRDYPVVSVEDPLAEDDWNGWQAASVALSTRQVVGDDLFVTDTERLREGISRGIANSVLVKPNQCGSLSAAHDVVRLAQRSNYSTVLSARSGETEDNWLADLSVGWRTGQLKVGSMTRSERTAKWNRLLRIEAELGDGAKFAGRAALSAQYLNNGTTEAS